MLAELHIENYAIIEKLSLQFCDGLCVITGETGAGKSLIVGALQLLLGGRGGTDRIRNGAQNMKIVAKFHPAKYARKILTESSFDADEVVISRRITSNGRSSFWINENPVSAETVRKIGDFLVDLHGQHSHQLLLDRNTHLSLLDDFARIKNIVDEVNKLFHRYHGVADELDKLRSQKDEILRQQRLIEFELNELEEAELQKPDEEEILERELEVIESAEKMIEFASKLSDVAIEREDSLIEIIGNLRREMEDFPHTDDVAKISQLFDTISAAADELGIIAENIAQIEYDPHRAEEIRARLKLLGDLQRKYAKNLPQLIEYRDRLSKEHLEIADVESREQKLAQNLEKVRTKLNESVVALSEKRQKSAEKLASAVERELFPLAMESAKFLVDLKTVPEENSAFKLNGEKVHLFENGFERCEFLLSANPGNPPKELRKIASGGELSRVALALKVALPASNRVGCSFFDEIDAGIGGRTAIKVAECLKKLSKNRQVIAITHLHPIARRANCHIYIEKKIEGNKTDIFAITLSKKQQKNELERMMALE